MEHVLCSPARDLKLQYWSLAVAWVPLPPALWQSINTTDLLCDVSVPPYMGPFALWIRTICKLQKSQVKWKFWMRKILSVFSLQYSIPLTRLTIGIVFRFKKIIISTIISTIISNYLVPINFSILQLYYIYDLFVARNSQKNLYCNVNPFMYLKKSILIF